MFDSCTDVRSADQRVAEGLDLIAQGLDQLRGVTLGEATDATIAEAVEHVHRLNSQLAGLGARAHGVFEARHVHRSDGDLSAAQWLAHRCRLPKGAAASMLWLARRLRTMPSTAAALERGEITEAAARLLAQANGPDIAAEFALAEETLVDHARTLPYADLVKLVSYWRQLVEPDAVEDEAAADLESNRAHLSQTLDGRWRLDADLDALSGAEVAESLRRIEKELFDAEWAELRAEVGDAATVSMLRSAEKRRAEAIVIMARRAHAMPKGARVSEPLITVLVDFPTLIGRVLELYNTGTVITPGQLAGLLTKADVEQIVFGPDGRVMEVGKRRRFFRGGLRRALQIRYRTCVHPGCDVPSTRCEMDHVQPAACDGPTTQDNGKPRCDHHHRRRPPPG